MIDNGTVRVDKTDTIFRASDYVYVRSDFEQVDVPTYAFDEDGNSVETTTKAWQCHEKKYSIAEWDSLLQEQSDSLLDQVVELQIALAESKEGVE